MRWNKNKLGCVLLVLLATGLIRVVVVLHEALADTLPPCALNKTLQLQLRVDELKRYSDTDWTGSFVVLPSVELMCQPLVDTKLRLSLRHPQPLILGQILNAQVKLKPLWGSLNVAGFDYRRWLAAKGYKATGYIQQANPLETPAVASITDRVRKRLIESDLKQASGLLALAVGDQEGLTTAHWARLRKTGTVHLFVISGLHVALVGGWLYLLLLTPLRVVAALATKPMPVQKIAMLLSLGGVFSYGWLSGFNPPVMRAVVMAGLVSLAVLMSRRTMHLRILLGTLILTMLVQPLSSLQQGFWLSYMAVAALCWGVMAFQRQPGRVLVFMRAQLVLFVAMAPLLGVLVGAVPVISIPANLLVVPVVTLVTLPSLLLGLLGSEFADGIGRWLLTLADISLVTVFAVLDWLLAIVPVHVQSFGYFSSTTAVLAGLAAFTCCLPLRFALRMVAVLGLLPMLLANTANLPLGEFRLQVLDVGQGSAALIDTRRHRIVVDAGPKIDTRFDAGESIVMPALRRTGSDRVDLLMLTHSDNDHAGGRQALADRYPDAQDIGAIRRCRDGHSWVWDRVRFTTLQYADGSNRNDRSCTLLIENQRQSVYLSGDIGIQAEHALVDRLPERLSVLVSPHHGSRSSSSSLFTRHVAPQWVIHSAGRFSRYGHPHLLVSNRYALECSRQLVTGLVGGITWSSADPERIFSQRLGSLTPAFAPGLHRLDESACAGKPTNPSVRRR